MFETWQRWRPLLLSRTAHLLAGTYGSYLANGLVVLATALAMPASERGEYVGYSIWIQFSASVISLGLGPALARRAARLDLSVGAVLLLPARALLHATPSIAIVGILGPMVAPQIFDGDVLLVTVAVVGVASIALTDWVGYVLQGFGFFRAYGILRFSVPAANLIWFGVLVVAGWTGPTDAVIALVGSTLLVGLAAVGFLLYHLPTSTRREPWFETYRFGVRAYWGALASAFTTRADGLVLSMLLSTTALSVYSLAVSVAMPVAVAGTALGVRAYRALESAGTMDLPGLVRIAIFRFSVLSVVGVGIAICAIFVLPFLLEPAYSALRAPGAILAFGAVGAGLMTLCVYLMQALNRPGHASLTQGVGGGFALIGVVLLAPRVGAVGAAIGTALGNLAGGAAAAYLLSRAIRGREVGA